MSALKPINHGASGGVQAHILRGEEPCDECRAGYRDFHTASRLRSGQTHLRVTAEVLGSLLIASGNYATRQYAISVLGPRTAAACIDRAAVVDHHPAPLTAVPRPAVVRQE